MRTSQRGVLLFLRAVHAARDLLPEPQAQPGAPAAQGAAPAAKGGAPAAKGGAAASAQQRPHQIRTP